MRLKRGRVREGGRTKNALGITKRYSEGTLLSGGNIVYFKTIDNTQTLLHRKGTLNLGYTVQSLLKHGVTNSYVKREIEYSS